MGYFDQFPSGYNYSTNYNSTSNNAHIGKAQDDTQWSWAQRDQAKYDAMKAPAPAKQAPITTSVSGQSDYEKKKAAYDKINGPGSYDVNAYEGVHGKGSWIKNFGKYPDGYIKPKPDQNEIDAAAKKNTPVAPTPATPKPTTPTPSVPSGAEKAKQEADAIAAEKAKQKAIDDAKKIADDIEKDRYQRVVGEAGSKKRRDWESQSASYAARATGGPDQSYRPSSEPRDMYVPQQTILGMPRGNQTFTKFGESINRAANLTYSNPQARVGGM